MPPEIQRKLTTILAADAEGYSRAMEQDEVRAHTALLAARGVFERFIQRHGGRIVNTAGDGLIADFPSVVEAVQCAIEVQQELGADPRAPGGALHFRIGIHLGDVIVDGDDLLGEGVNLAARLESMAEPGSVLISQQVYDQVYRKLGVGFEYLGPRRAKNLSDEIPVYRVSQGAEEGWRIFGSGARQTDVPRRQDARPENAQRAPHGDPVHEEPANRAARRARQGAILWAAILAVDLLTGPGFWAHWPGIVIATLVALDAVPLVARGWIDRNLVRAGVLIAALAAVNAVTWAGTAWVVWPAGVVIIAALWRRFATVAR